MSNIEEAKRLLEEALEKDKPKYGLHPHTCTRMTEHVEKLNTHILFLLQKIKATQAVLDNMEEGDVENYEIAYRQGWQAAKVSGLDEPPAKEQSPLEKMDNPVGYWQVEDTGKSSTALEIPAGEPKPRTGRECPDCGYQTEEKMVHCPKCLATMFDITFEHLAEPQTITEEQAAKGLERGVGR